MIDAHEQNADHLRPGHRIVIVGQHSLNRGCIHGDHGTIVSRQARFIGGTDWDLFIIEVDDGRRVLVSPNMVAEDDELPQDEHLRERVEALQNILMR